MMRLIVRIIVGVVLAAVLGFVLVDEYVSVKGSEYIAASVDKLPQAQAAIILGAAITEKGVPSPVLEDRVSMAMELYKTGKVTRILMSGSNGTSTYDEVDPVRKDLIQNGIPAEDIFLDHAGFDTYSSMYRAKTVFGVTSAVIVTQDFHLPRALYLARSLGIDAYGIPADRSLYSAKNYFRELLSRPKAFIDIVSGRIPKYVGEPIPITGDGTKT